MQELFLKIGKSANIRIVNPKPCRIRGGAYDTAIQYHVSETKTKSALLRKSDSRALFDSVNYEGMVHCVTVPNGTLVTRRNGKMAIAGNCEAMAYAAGHLLGVQRMPKRDAPEEVSRETTELEEAIPEPSLPAIALRTEKPKAPARPRTVVRSSFLR